MAINVTIDDGTITGAMISSAAAIPASRTYNRYSIPYTQTGRKARNSARSVWFDLDNGSGTTIDDVIMRPTTAITITAARVIYVDATSGTVAAGTVQIGSTVGGVDIVAATNYENSKAVGTQTALSIASGAVAAGAPVIVRHTGVAATAAGQVVVEIEYTVALDSGTVYDETVEIHTAQYAGSITGIAVSCTVAPTSTTSFTVDLKKGSTSAAFASVLASPVSYTSSRSNKEKATGTINTSAYGATDILQLVIACTAGSGVQATGLSIDVYVDEEGA